MCCNPQIAAHGTSEITGAVGVGRHAQEELTVPTVETADGTRLYYKEWGTGRPVVFVHGWPFNADMWDAQMIAVARAGYRAIAYDRRGFGRSDQPWSGYDYDTLSDDLATVVKATEADDFTLVGFSMGGGEIARYMSRHEGRGVASAVLIATIVPYIIEDDTNSYGAPLEALQGMKAALLDDRETLLRQVALPPFFGIGTPAGADVTPEILDAAIAWSRLAGTHPLAAAIDLMSTDFRPEMATFTVPTLFMQGTDDVNTPVWNSRAGAAAVEGSELIEYEGHPHAIYATARDTLNADLVAFLRKTGGRKI